jgi:cell division protein FtsB
MGGFWWIFPVIGVSIALVLVIAMVRAMGGGRPFMCMGGQRSAGSDEVAQLTREVRELREEIKQLKDPR